MVRLRGVFANLPFWGGGHGSLAELVVLRDPPRSTLYCTLLCTSKPSGAAAARALARGLAHCVVYATPLDPWPAPAQRELKTSFAFAPIYLHLGLPLPPSLFPLPRRLGTPLSCRVAAP